MTTIAKGNTAEIYVPVSCTVTITPGSGGSVRVSISVPSGSEVVSPQIIYAETDFPIPAGSHVFAEAINADATYTDPALSTVASGDAVRSLVSGARNTLALVGDSFVANWRNDVASTYETYPEGFVTWALQLSGQCMTVISDQSRGGSYVTNGGGAGTDFSVQMAAAAASGARHVLMMGGINDVINGVPNVTIKAAFLQHVAAALDAGMTVWWCAPPTFPTNAGSYTVAKQAQLLELADWVRQQANTSVAKGGVVVIDTASKLIDPASAVGGWYANSFKADNLHPVNSGGYRMGKEIARVWSARVPEVPLLLSSAADQYGFSSASNNVLDNGLFLSGTPTGTGFVQSVTGTGSNTPSIVARSDGYGNDQQQLCVFGAANDSVVLTTPDMKARLSVGDWVQASCEVTVSSLTNYRGARLSLIVSSTTSYSAIDSQNSTSDGALPEGHTIMLATKPFQITAAMGTISSITSTVTFRGAGAGGVTGKIGRWAVRKLTALA